MHRMLRLWGREGQRGEEMAVKEELNIL